MRRVWLLLSSVFALSAHAQSWELGARYWYSQATTTRSHNAQGAVPSLGNPTSVLTYTNLDAHALELHGRKDFGSRGFLRANAGLGEITRGSFDDEDFFAGQVKFSDSTSRVKGKRLAYATLDIGRELWSFRNGTAGLFAGYNHWTERIDAYGATFTVGGGAEIPAAVPVITNEVTWQSLRVGLTATTHMTAQTRLSLDAAWVPYARVRDEDSHWLRQAPSDLGAAPNILVDGRGQGVQLDLALRRQLSDRWEFGAGLRYWRLRATTGSRVAAGTSLPLNQIESQRGGVLVDLTRRW